MGQRKALPLSRALCEKQESSMSEDLKEDKEKVRRALFRKHGSLLMIGLYVPFMLLLNKLSLATDQVMVFVAFYFVTFFALAISAGTFVCPSCGNRFFTSMFRSTIFSTKCLHCGFTYK